MWGQRQIQIEIGSEMERWRCLCVIRIDSNVHEASMKEGKNSSWLVAAVSCGHGGAKVSLSNPHKRVLGIMVAHLEVKMYFR